MEMSSPGAELLKVTSKMVASNINNRKMKYNMVTPRTLFDGNV